MAEPFCVVKFTVAPPAGAAELRWTTKLAVDVPELPSRGVTSELVNDAADAAAGAAAANATNAHAMTSSRLTAPRSSTYSPKQGSVPEGSPLQSGPLAAGPR